MHQGAGNGHALQLTSAELLRQPAAQCAQAYGIEHGLHAGRFRLAQQHQRQGHVLRHVQVRQHVKGLEHKPHMGAAPQGAGGVIQIGQPGGGAIGGGVGDVAFVPLVQPRKAVEQGGFAHARVPHDGHELAGLHGEVDLSEHGRAAVVLAQVLNGERAVGGHG